MFNLFGGKILLDGVAKRLLGISLVAGAILVSNSEIEAAEVIQGPTYTKLNRVRPIRKSTRYLILHTTESRAGSIHKLSRYGEANYLIDTRGDIIEILNPNRVAYHAGLSMWQRLTELSQHSVGIEVEGFHHQDLNPNQIAALRELLLHLKSFYNLSDNQILAHAMVAYDTPNTWHRGNHRGRKKCGMQFAKDQLRAQMGLSPLNLVDPDVVSGRLDRGDHVLFNFLYGSPTEARQSTVLMSQPRNLVIDESNSAWDIAQEAYDDRETIYTFPNGEQRKGNQIRRWNSLPKGTRVSFSSCRDNNCPQGVPEPPRQPEESPVFDVIGEDGQTAWSIAKGEYDSKTTIYFIPYQGRMRILTGAELVKSSTVDADRLPNGTKILQGYIYGGRVTRDRLAWQITRNWRSKSTVYYNVDSSEFRFGNQIRARYISKNTRMFFKSRL